MAQQIEIRTFSTMPELATEGWDPDRCDGACYRTARAAALYEALGVSTSDEEYTLAQHDDGRWALFGRTVTGHRYAVEVSQTIRSAISGTFTYYDLAALGAPIAWQGTVSKEERARQEADLEALIDEARLVIDASGGRPIEIKDGEIVALIHESDADLAE